MRALVPLPSLIPTVDVLDLTGPVCAASERLFWRDLASGQIALDDAIVAAVERGLTLGPRCHRRVDALVEWTLHSARNRCPPRPNVELWELQARVATTSGRRLVALVNAAHAMYNAAWHAWTPAYWRDTAAAYRIAARSARGSERDELRRWAADAELQERRMPLGW